MKALVYNGGLHYRTDYPVPEPTHNEALVRIRAAGICNTDLEIVKGYMGFKGIPGHEFVGIVEKCAEKGLTGKRVTGEINIGCGTCDYCLNKLSNHCADRSVLGIARKDGAFAEYITLPVNNLHIIPDTVSDEEAVFIEPLAAAFEILEQINILPSDRVCVIGDGKLGILVAQVLAMTDCDLVAAGKHEDKLSILEKMGIKTRLGTVSGNSPLWQRGVRGDFQQDKFDIVIDCTGSPHGIGTALKIVKPRGKIVLKTTLAENAHIDLNQFVINEITLIGSRCGPFLPAIKAIEEKKVDLLPLVSRKMSIADGIEGFKLAAEKGVLKVILTVD